MKDYFLKRDERIGYCELKSQWISVKDRLPEDGIDILFYDGYKIMIGHIEKSTLSMIGNYYNATETKWQERYRFPVENVTHWMSLPESPK